MQLPMGAENDFVGNIDLLTMEALTYPAKDDKGNDTLGSIVERGPIPAEYQERPRSTARRSLRPPPRAPTS